jgi:putative nucleotidyltransferase with HDIG domain
MDPIKLSAKLHLKPLPMKVVSLLRALNSPERLIAHLLLVHDVACSMSELLKKHCPNLEYDVEAVLFGAATHDIGKSIHRQELIAPGNLHEQEGVQLLLAHGFEPRLARFAYSHAADLAEGNLTLEDLLVALADTCWKGKRDVSLESKVATWISQGCSIPLWEATLKLEDILEQLTHKAPERLQWQSFFSL